MRVLGIHHVQITVEPREINSAREFYCGVLGFVEIEKPASLRDRGGFWIGFGGRQLHVGVETGVDRAATKGHVAYEVENLSKWRSRLEAAGVRPVESIPIPGFERFEFRDPFGNRVEFIARAGSTD
jgi:catechol 2,3-dioxygenase-like lactoylglutathione lyase family enzyme